MPFCLSAYTLLKHSDQQLRDAYNSQNQGAQNEEERKAKEDAVKLRGNQLARAIAEAVKGKWPEAKVSYLKSNLAEFARESTFQTFNQFYKFIIKFCLNNTFCLTFY